MLQRDGSIASEMLGALRVNAVSVCMALLTTPLPCRQFDHVTVADVFAHRLHESKSSGPRRLSMATMWRGLCAVGRAMLWTWYLLRAPRTLYNMYVVL